MPHKSPVWRVKPKKKKSDRSDYEKLICLDTKTTHTPPKVTEKIIRQKEKEDL